MGSSDSVPVQQSAYQSTWTFTQGFILGQASFLLIILVFIRYVVFSPAEATDDESWKKRRAERLKRSKLSTTAVPPPPTHQVLSKTGYDMATHPAESSGWTNVLIAQILQGYRNDLLSEGGEEGARQRIERWLNPDNGKMSWLDPIQVTGLSLGTSYPLLSNARIRPADNHGRVRAEIDVDYLDSLSLSLSTCLLINFPTPRFATLPVSLGVELVSIGGTMSLQIHEPAGERQHVHACLLPDFHLNLKTTTLLGSRAKLQDVPKLEQLIVSRIRGVIQDRCVHPHHLTLALPRILSPSIAPTPILNDIGEGTVRDMSEALRQGMEGAVQKGLNNLLVPSTSMDSVTAVLDTPTPNPDAAAGPPNGDVETPLGPKIITEQVEDDFDSPSRPPTNTQLSSDSIPTAGVNGHGDGPMMGTGTGTGGSRITQRRIPMPSDFPISQQQPQPQRSNTAPSAAASSSISYGATHSTTSTTRAPVTPAHSRTGVVGSRQTGVFNAAHNNVNASSSSTTSPSVTGASQSYRNPPPQYQHSSRPSTHSNAPSYSGSVHSMSYGNQGPPAPPSHISRASSSGISLQAARDRSVPSNGYQSQPHYADHQGLRGIQEGMEFSDSQRGSRVSTSGSMHGSQASTSQAGFRFRGQFAGQPER